MNVPVGETCILHMPTVLWKEYPSGEGAESGASWEYFDVGTALMVVGEQSWAGRFFSYVLDCTGNTFVTPSEYLSLRIRVMR